jgi:4,5-DOPA dioxygenase extradiol
MSLKSLINPFNSGSNTERMPVVFLGHGSPMNAIEENEFVRGFREVGKTLPRPRAILCISAHWETRGTKVIAMENPLTIHDFGCSHPGTLPAVVVHSGNEKGKRTGPFFQ